MKCLKCQADNPDSQKFCGECGAKLERVCQKCGASNLPKYSFCGKCGYDLSTPSGKSHNTKNGKTTKRHTLRNFLIAFTCILVVAAIGTILINMGLPTYQQGAITYPPAPIQQSPSAPSNLSGHANSHSQITIRWADSSYNEDGFRIYRNDLPIGSVGPNANIFQDTGLQSGTAYNYSVAAYNGAGEVKSATTIQVKTLNPPILVTLDRIGVLFDHDPWPKGTGEIYLYLAISDGNGEPQVTRVPATQGTEIELNDNETKEIHQQIFSTNCVGDELKIVAVAFESDDPMVEALVNLLRGALTQYLSGGTGEVLNMIDILLASNPSADEGSPQGITGESPADDFVGAIEETWTSASRWGVGSQSYVSSGDLQLWFTISMPIDTTSSLPPEEATKPPATIPPTVSHGHEKVVSFIVVPKEDYVFSINIKNSQTLHLAWQVTEGSKVWFHIITPSGRSLGFYENGEFADGTLEDGFCQGFTRGNTAFSPSQYGWGEGDYQMYINSDFGAQVEVHYRIED
ncbi:MAG: zinc ribbon domain-containing protein [Dehalococcoidia bacterium]|nr:zinc ribbon domain-containing protein [Dehalococcoidia bacterium]